MKNVSLTIVMSFIALLSFAQSGRFSVSAHYGPAGNFFVRSYDETGGPAATGPRYLYKKNFIGSIAGIDLTYRVSPNSALGVAYSRAINKGTKNFQSDNMNVNLIINDFDIRHINDFFQMYYERNFVRNNPTWTYHAGIVYARMQQQEIEYYPSQVILNQRNVSNSGMEEGGFFGGIRYAKKIDTHFDLGLKIRAYYLVSVQQLEAITFTPVLTYRF